MYTGALTAAAQLVLAHCVALVAHAPPAPAPPDEPRPVAKSKIELTPIDIECELTDFIIISAAVIKANDTRYFLYKPNGQARELNISRPNFQKELKEMDNYNSDIKVKFITNTNPIVTPFAQFEVFNVNRGQRQDSPDTFAESKAAMRENDFMLGPLDYRDYGNWVLSLYFTDNQTEWTEAFQVITLRIIETVPARPDYGFVILGTDFSLQFAYPLEDIETCELKVPTGTFNRFYSTNSIDRKNCGYIVHNVTAKDEGLWKIIGVGKIAYVAYVQLKVIPVSLTDDYS